MESLVLNDLIKPIYDLAGNIELENPNAGLASHIKATLSAILKDYGKCKDIKTVGFITSNYYEDWYNTALLYEVVKDLPFEFVLGDVAGLYVQDGKWWHSNRPLDAVYRFYPLDWLEQDPYFEGAVEALSGETLSINPPSTLICQSKAFFALMGELAKQGFYQPHEVDFIHRYLPKTALTPKQLGTSDFVAKAYFGREGQDIHFNYSGKLAGMKASDYIFQERIDLQAMDFERVTTLGTELTTAYPIMGTYVVGSKCQGIFVRAGGKITDQWAVFMPTYIME